MAVQAAYAFAVPAPYDEDFLNGEQAVAVATPITAAAGNTTFYVSRWFDFEGGVYTFRVASDDAAVWIAAMEQSNGRVLFSTAIGNGVVDISAYVPRGRQRLDLILVNTSAGASSCWFAFSLWKAGTLVYTSSGTGWVFDTATIDDADVPTTTDRRLTFPLFPFMPNWRGGIVERLITGTEIFTSETDKEQRRGVRRYPLRTFEAEFARWAIGRARLDIFLTNAGKHELLVPLWHEQFVLSETLGLTLEFPEETLAMREFHEGDLVAVIDGLTQFEILTIESIELDTVTFADAPVGTWAAGSKIYPLRVARILESPQFSNPTDGVGVVQIRFAFDAPETWPTPDWGYCVPFFRFRVNRATDIENEFDRLAYVFENPNGLIDLIDTSEAERISMRCGVMLKGRAEMYAFRQFLQQARGRALRFWMPDHMRDLFAATDTIGGTYFDVKDSGYFDYLTVPQDARRTIGISFKDGRPAVYRDIVSVERVIDVDRLTLDRVMPPVQSADIERISFIMPVRFEQDSFELRHHVDDSAVITTGVAVRSVDRGDLPDIECFTTSRPYPIDFSEALDVAASFAGGDLRELGYDPEALDVDAAFAAAELRYPLIDYDMVEEALDVSALFTAGTLRLGLIGYDMVEEALDVSALFAAGSLRVALIEYEEYAAEALDVSAAFVGGTLS